jgi:excisionase family DNA binding protein
MATDSAPFISVARAARICDVSRRTVLNWISRGQLRAHRLPNGHYRIHRDVFRAFLSVNRPDVALGRFDLEARADNMCWSNLLGSPQHNCVRCLVYRTQTVHCFVLRDEVGHDPIGCTVSCSSCEHLIEIYQQISFWLEIEEQPATVARGGSILGANLALRQLVGMTDRDVLGMPWMQFIDPADYPTLVSKGAEIRANPSLTEMTMEAHLLHQDGTRIRTHVSFTWFRRIWGSYFLRFTPHDAD